MAGHTRHHRHSGPGERLMAPPEAIAFARRAREIAWPVVAIHYEASSLGPAGYPIEVGVATWGGIGQPLYRWSTLIRPTREWLEHGQWSPDSSLLHGISPEELCAGLPPLTVARALNEVLRNIEMVWSDGGAFDVLWTHRLFAAAGLAPAFSLREWRHFPAKEEALSDSIADYLTVLPAARRAGPDAERLLRSLMSAMDVDGAQAVDLSKHIALFASLALFNV